MPNLGCGVQSHRVSLLLPGQNSLDNSSAAELPLLQIMEKFPNEGKEINLSTSILSGLEESHGTC